MKKLSLSLAVLFLFAVFAGCGNRTAKPSGQQSQTTEYITEAEAKAIALEHANVAEADAAFVQVKFEKDGPTPEYEIEFYFGNKEYDYEIDAVTGDILSYDTDAEFYNMPQNNPQATASITEQEAKNIALNHAGVSESDATFVQVKLDAEGIRKEYDIEFYAGNKEYDYEIDASTGDILSYDADAEYYNVQTAPKTSSGSVTEESAKQTALTHAGVREADISYLNVHYDYDDGRELFDVEFYVGRTEYSYEIDANTGAIVEYDVDRD